MAWLILLDDDPGECRQLVEVEPGVYAYCNDEKVEDAMFCKTHLIIHLIKSNFNRSIIRFCEKRGIDPYEVFLKREQRGLY